jgi:ribosomal protein S18 acetylase RimI-like enzyme
MFTIRRIAEDDVEAVVPLKQEVHELHASARPDFFRSMTADAIGAWLRERLDDPATEAWVAHANGTITGYLLAAERRRPQTAYSEPRRWLEVDEVSVARAARRRGVARGLFEHAAVHARQAGLSSVELTTWAFNDAARAAFSRLGAAPMITRFELDVASFTSIPQPTRQT